MTAEASATIDSRARRLWRWASDRFPEILFLIVTTGAGLWAAGRWLDPIGDPGFSWSLGYRLAHGERLYRDIYVAYGPLSPYLLALWARLFGTASLSVILMNWIPAILAGLLLLQCARRFLLVRERACLVAMILATSIFVPGPGRLVLPYYAGVVHALAFGIGALLLFHAARPSGRAVLAGLFVGLAFCCKQEIGAAALAALLASFSTGIDRPVRKAGAVLAGFFGVLLVAASFVAQSASLESLRDRSHLWPLNPRTPVELDLLFRSVSGLAEPGWFAALRASAWRLLAELGLLAVLGGLLARERGRAAWQRLLWLGAALGVWWAVERFPIASSSSPVRLSVLIALLVAALALFQPGLAHRGLLISLSIFAGLAGVRAIFSPFGTGAFDGPAHFVAALTWAFLLFLFVPTLLWPPGRAADRTRQALCYVLLPLFAWDALGGAESLRFPWKIPVVTPSGTVYLEAGQAALLQAVGRNLARGERILVFPEINGIDALFEAHSSSPLLAHLPGWFDSKLEAELIARCEREPPSWVILFAKSRPEFGIGPFGQGFGGTIAKWYFRNYRVVFLSPRGTILKLRRSPADAGSETALGRSR